MKRTTSDRPIHGHQTGGVLLLALLTIAILSLIAATIIPQLSRRYHSSFHSASWQEALFAAEAGADLAMLSVNMAETDPTNAWVGWTGPDASGIRSISYGPSTNPPLASHIGEGNNKLHAAVQVDTLLSGRRTWYRIRSRGTTELPGPARGGGEISLLDVNGNKNHNSMLWKLNFTTDRTAGVLKAPQVSRSIEIMAQQVSSSVFVRALTVKEYVNLSSSSVIDSYDSSDPAKSTSGRFDSLKRQSNGDVATSSIGNTTNLANGAVYGDAMSNGGVMSNTGGVRGGIYNNFSTEFPAVAKPKWAYLTPGPIRVSGSATLNAGSVSSPTYYKLTGIDLASSDVLTLGNPTPGQDAYIELWVTGSIDQSGSSAIVLDPGVRATIHVEGLVGMSGSGVLNPGKPEMLLFKGITPANPSDWKAFTYSGSSAFSGVIYAPSYVIDLGGQGAVSGAAVGKRCTIGGQGTMHYDEALSKLDIGGSGNFQVASWVEDIR